MLERDYQSKLIRKLKKQFPDAIILKNDPTYIQGIPDLLILHGDKWAALEVKNVTNAKLRPNQDYYISKMRSMGYAALICPENERSILNEVQRALEPGRTTCIPERE